MPEYTYLLETRLTAAQQNSLAQVRDAAREAGMVVFLTGGAVRDLTTGSSVRDLDFSIQGDALGLEPALVARGAAVLGRHEDSRTLFLWFPGSVRVEVSSTRAERFPKPGQPEYTWTGIVDDLFRRDFTVNAMALSLNEGSYGLLLDPLNGVADTEARQLRLVSSYGFLEDPARLLRAVRLALRLGWSMEERTARRYENAKEADALDALSPFRRGYELEEIAAEEDALATIRALEAEGWMEKLLPEWSSAHADTAALDDLHRNRIQLLVQGIAADLMAAHLELLTAKMSGESRATLKQKMVRSGLIAQWEQLSDSAREFNKLLTGKDAAAPSAAWKLFHEHSAEAVLWLAHTGKGAGAEKFKQLFTVWPEVAKKIPASLMTEMRITPELPAYAELLHELFLQQIDGKLQDEEAMRAFLERYSPPLPPPPVNLKRARSSRKAETKSKRRAAIPDEPADTDLDADSDDDEGDSELTAETAESEDADEMEEAESSSETAAVPVEPMQPQGQEAPVNVERAPARVAAPPNKATASERIAAHGKVNLAGVDVAAVLERLDSPPARSPKSAEQPVSVETPAAGKVRATVPAPQAKQQVPVADAKPKSAPLSNKPPLTESPRVSAARPAPSRTKAPAAKPPAKKTSAKAAQKPVPKAPSKKAAAVKMTRSASAKAKKSVPARAVKKAAPQPAAGKKTSSVARPAARPAKVAAKAPAKKSSRPTRKR